MPPAPKQSHHTDNPDDEDILTRLIDRSLAVVRREYAELAAELEAEQDVPPEALLIALRSPIGPPRIVRLIVHSRRVRAEIIPQGRIDYESEQRVWDCIRDTVLEVA